MSPSRIAKANSKIDWLSVLQFAASTLGLVFLWSAALALFIYAVYQLALGPSQTDEPVNILLTGAGMLWVGVLLLPSVATSFAHLLKRPFPKLALFRGLPRNLLGLPFVLLPPIILLGELVTQKGLPWLLPPFHVAAATLSVAGLLGIALYNLDLGGLQRRWGAFASGLTAGPVLATLLEVATTLLIIIAIAIYALFNPQFSSAIEAFSRNLNSFLSNPQTDFPALQTLMNNPVVIGLLLINLSIFVPLIEELVKPIAVWFLMWGRVLSPAQGFGLGMLSGAGFALAENLFSGASVSGWADTTFVRIGATAFHLATAGLMGWALVRARGQRRYLGLFGVYAFNILIHGTWNAAVILSSRDASAQLSFALPIDPGYILLAVTVVAVGIIVTMNRVLQPELKPSRVIKKQTVTKTKSRK